MTRPFRTARSELRNETPPCHCIHARCGQYTRGSKPYCPDHGYRNKYAALVLARLARRRGKP